MNRRSLALAASSGIMLAAAFPATDWYPVVWISLVPLLIAVKEQTVKNAFLLGGIMGILFFALEIHWLAGSIANYGGIPLILSSFVTLLLCAYLALYPALFCGALARLRINNTHLFLIAAPAIWTALELVRTFAFGGFPWSLLGTSQYRVLPVIQIADVTGVYGVSYVVVLANIALAEFFMDRKRWTGIVTAALVLALVLVYGFVRIGSPEVPGTVSISVIQGNVDQDKKWDPAYRSATVAKYERLSREAIKQNPSLVIWPETATPFYFHGIDAADRTLSADIVNFVRTSGTPLLFGSPTLAKKYRGTVDLHNSAFLLSRNGDTIGRYNKVHLVPFGEYVPFRTALFSFSRIVKAAGDFLPGEDYTIMAIPDKLDSTRPIPFCTVICYEIIFPNLVRTFVDRGATVIATITNDGWFGRSSAPYQHFSTAVFRAVENRVPVARAANTGISGFIDAKGRILAASPIFTEDILTRTLAPGTMKTFYTRYGDIFSFACVLLTILLLAGFVKNLRR